MDGTALGLVLQDIKLSLRLTDTQLGLMTGLAFAAFYAVVGVPLARWADRGNRVLIISLAAALWSVMVALCSVAANFTQLLFIRMGVAVGESGCIPPANSLLADYFERAERPRAAAIYMMGPSLSMLIGYGLAGWLNERFGWRTMFVLLGLPGLIPAAVAWLTLKEPRRVRWRAQAAVDGARALEAAAAHPPASFLETVRILWANATFRHLLSFFSIAYFFGCGILQWQPAFFMRSYHLSSGELGQWFALIYGLGGLLGTYGGGQWASRYAGGRESLQLKVAALTYAAFALISACVYLSPNRYVAFALMGLAAAGTAATLGPLFAAIQTLVPQQLRAVSIAIVYLSANLIGLGLGPLAAGALSDALRPVLGEESLRYSLLILCPGYVWGAWHLWRASRIVS